MVLDSVASMGDLEISTFAFWQKDKNYRWWTEDENGWGRSMWVAGIRPYHQITRKLLPCSTSWATNTWMTKTTKGVNGKGKGGPDQSHRCRQR
ncbi:maltoporin [Klebsiella pneumoniae]|uniref:Maltoporin n=1 Tax=Klebsiella pneumoniae TaxID=573 RepID=A0A3S4H6R3_KLEPN|nr:maltoporin [Klebsiella pneumoniae]